MKQDDNEQKPTENEKFAEFQAMMLLGVLFLAVALIALKVLGII